MLDGQYELPKHTLYMTRSLKIPCETARAWPLQFVVFEWDVKGKSSLMKGVCSTRVFAIVFTIYFGALWIFPLGRDRRTQWLFREMSSNVLKTLLSLLSQPEIFRVIRLLTVRPTCCRLLPFRILFPLVILLGHVRWKKYLGWGDIPECTDVYSSRSVWFYIDVWKINASGWYWALCLLVSYTCDFSSCLHASQAWNERWVDFWTPWTRLDNRPVASIQPVIGGAIAMSKLQVEIKRDLITSRVQLSGGISVL